MDRILIIGCAGAGKSTLAQKMGKKLGLPVVHLDRLFWHSGWVESTPEEIDEKILLETEKEQWILDGNYSRTLPMRLQYCDTVIFLDFPRAACLLGVLKRVITTYGTVRADMAPGCPERFDWDFMRWVWNFNSKHRENYYRLLESADHAQPYVLKSRRQVKCFLRSLHEEKV